MEKVVPTGYFKTMAQVRMSDIERSRRSCQLSTRLDVDLWLTQWTSRLASARRVQQSTAKFSYRCYRRAGRWSSFDRGETKNAATAETAATATTDLDEETASETENFESSNNHDTRKITADFENVRKTARWFQTDSGRRPYR